MATYAEILAIAKSPIGQPLREKLLVAAVVACDVIRLEAGATPNHANRLLWTKSVLTNPEAATEQLLWALLAQNRAFTQAQITGADDATVQSAVNSAIDLLAQG